MESCTRPVLSTPQAVSGAFPSVAGRYANVIAMIAALNASGTFAHYVDFKSPGPSRATRANLFLLGVGAATKNVSEQLYLVSHALDGTDAVRVEKIADVTGVTTVASGDKASDGSDVMHCSLSVSPTGLLAARTGQEMRVSNAGGNIGSITIDDVGWSTLGILRVRRVGSSDSDASAATKVLGAHQLGQ